jgi:hypothetical protein
VPGIAIVLEPERPSNRMPKRNDPEFAPIPGRTTAKDVKRVQREDNRNDRALAKKNGVRFKG